MKITMKVLIIATIIELAIAASSSGMAAGDRDSAVRRLGSDIATRFMEQNNYGGDDNGSGNSCDFGFDDYGAFTLTCNMCYGNSCVNEVCNSDSDFAYLDCNVCITDQSGSSAYEEFCMATICDMNSYLENQNMEAACTCQGVSVDGNDCETCSFCANDNQSYDLQTQVEQGASTQSSSLTQGLDLQCSAAEEFNSSCSTSKQRRSSSGNANKMTLFVATSLVAVAAVLGLLFWRQKKEEDPKSFTLVDDSANTNINTNSKIGSFA